MAVLARKQTDRTFAPQMGYTKVTSALVTEQIA